MSKNKKDIRSFTAVGSKFRERFSKIYNNFFQSLNDGEKKKKGENISNKIFKTKIKLGLKKFSNVFFSQEKAFFYDFLLMFFPKL